MTNYPNKKIIPLLMITIFSFFYSCVDTNTIPGEEENKDQATYRIPLGDCQEFQSPAESFSAIWNDLLSQPGGTASKGCSGINACHSATANQGGWNLGNTPNVTETYANIVGRSGISGKPLITPNDLENSYIIVKLSLNDNPEPKNGELWFNSDLQRLKRWVCQNAQNN